MSKAKFDAAKELIEGKHYNEARGILKTIDHPTARAWEAKLDKLDPLYVPDEPETFSRPAAPLPLNTKPIVKKNKYGCRTYLLVLLAIIVVYAVTRPTSSPSPRNTPTLSAAEIANLNGTATIIALTPGPTAEPTKPPPTPAYGVKDNPFPTGRAGGIRDGRFQVNDIRLNQTSAVEKMNMFNSDPPDGGEWVLVNVTFYCDVPSDKTCIVTLMDLELIGKNGTVYNTEFATVLDNKFSGEVFGGGQKTGDVAFIINSNDSGFMVAVNDLGGRTFFRAS